MEVVERQINRASTRRIAPFDVHIITLTAVYVQLVSMKFYKITVSLENVPENKRHF